MKAETLFTLPSDLPFDRHFRPESAPWEWVGAIKSALSEFDEFGVLPKVVPSGFSISGVVYIHPSVELPPFGSIKGPVFIGEGCELRPGVYIRGNVIAGRACVLGNSCEFKNALLLDQVQVPHFSYVGDSVLGNKSHLGAGVICSNLRLDQAPVEVSNFSSGRLSTDMRKLGALVGDQAEVGCNTVLNPGSILGKRSLVAPSMSFRGTLEGGKLAFQGGKILQTNRPDAQ